MRKIIMLYEVLGISKIQIYVVILLIFTICSALIKTNRFTRTNNIITGIILIKDKKTGKEYVQHKDGNITKLN